MPLLSAKLNEHLNLLISSKVILNGKDLCLLSNDILSPEGDETSFKKCELKLN